jgi:hypothetical protein
MAPIDLLAVNVAKEGINIQAGNRTRGMLNLYGNGLHCRNLHQLTIAMNMPTE